jgi:hypothetical protein
MCVQLSSKHAPTALLKRRALRLQACDKYEAALQLRAGSQGALYNWGVALSELAHWYREHEKAVAGDTSRSTTPVSGEGEAAGGKGSEEEASASDGAREPSYLSREELREAACSCLHLASQKYAQCLNWHPNNPQALNNWGLVLQVLPLPMSIMRALRTLHLP